MADFIIGGQVNIDGGNAEKSVGNIKTQLRDAQKELIAMSDKFGATSREAVNAAKKVGELKDKIGDAKTLSDAFNPDAKFKGFANALQGVAGGFAAIQGAQAVFGNQSEDLAKTLAKVQGAMALSQGINSVLESRDAFKALGAQLMQFTIVQKIVTAAQKLWNAAMKANPIGALVVAITLLISGISALVIWLSSSAKAAKAQEAAVKEQTKAIESQNKTLERNNTLFEKSQSQQLALAKAQGQSAEAIRALEIKLADEKIAYEKSSAAIAKNTMDKQRNLYETLKASGASDDVVKKQLDNLNKSIEGYNNENKNIEKALINKKDIENRHLVEIEQEKTNARKEESTNNKNHKKELLDKEKKHNEDIANANKSLQQQLKALREENYLSTFKDEDKRAQAKLILDFENKRKEINQSIADEDLKQKALAELDINYTNQKNAITEARALKDKEAKDKQAQTELDAMFAQLDAELAFTDELIKADDERVAKEKKNSEDRIKQAELEAQAKAQYYKDIGNAMGILSDLIGKDTAAGKALAVAQATINTFVGATEVLRAKSVLPEPAATISKVVNVAAIVASGIKSVKEILKTKVPGGSGGGGGSLPSATSAAAIQAPIQAQLQTTTLNQSQIQQMGNAAVRSFVVESDVSGNQERIRRLNRAARIN